MVFFPAIKGNRKSSAICKKVGRVVTNSTAGTGKENNLGSGIKNLSMGRVCKTPYGNIYIVAISSTKASNAPG